MTTIDLPEKPSDTEFCPDPEQLYLAIMDLMPPGAAWDNIGFKVERDSNIRKFIYALAEVWQKLEYDTCMALDEWFCISATVDRDAWEADYGVPDECQLFNENVCDKVSPPQSLDADYLLGRLSALGYTASLRWLTGDDPEFPGVYSTLRVMVDEANSIALQPQTMLPFSLGPFGYLGEPTNTVDTVSCMLERIIPAHCVIDTGLTGNFTPAVLGSKLKALYLADNLPDGVTASWSPTVGTIDLTGAGGASPLSAVSDGVRWLEFDGVNDVLTSTATIAIPGISELFALVRIDQITNTRSIVTSHNNGRQINSLSVNDSFYDRLVAIGLQAASVMLFDAGDSVSFNGTSQTWTGRAATAMNLFRGATSGTETSDPTFNGTAGARSFAEYFSFDGTDYFTATAQPAWVTGLHKNQAKWTAAFIVKFGAVNIAQALFATAQNASDIGIRIGLTATGELLFNAYNGSGTPALQMISNLKPIVDQWHFVAFAFNEGDKATLWLDDLSFEVVGPALATPSAANPTRVVQLGANGNLGAFLPAGSQIIGAFGWPHRLSNSEVDALRDAIMPRLSLTPTQHRIQLKSGAVELSDQNKNAGGIISANARYAVDSMRGRVNGAKTIPTSVTLPSAPADGVLRVGGGQGFLKGGVNAIAFTEALTDVQRTQFEAWLLWKVGRPDLLPGDHPYRNVRP